MNPAFDPDNGRCSHLYSNGNICLVTAVEVMIAEIRQTWRL